MRVDRLGGSNVRDMIAAWDGSNEALQYHIGSSISWGPFELTAISESLCRCARPLTGGLQVQVFRS